MKILITLAFCLILRISTFGQSVDENETTRIVAEGKRMYKSEMASWYGTDLFLEKYNNLSSEIGGYFSYSDNEIAKCIFYSNAKEPRVIGTISFDSTYDVKTAIVDGTKRLFTEFENQLYTIRLKALSEINSDTLFKKYENTNLNLIPMIYKDERKVFVLTGPKNDGVVIFGNDYLITFDKKNNLTEKKKIHNNIIELEFKTGNKKEGKTVGGIHSHLPSTGDYITSTDICTLMLYEKFAHWEQYYVMSENYISIWNCKTDQLITLTRKAWDKINNGGK